MNTEYVKLTEAARKLAMHADTVRYWVKLLGVATIKQEHTCYVTAETLGVLVVMARLVGEGVPASEAAARAKDEAPAETTVLAVRPAGQAVGEVDELKDRLQGLERVILSMAETFKTEVSGLRADIARLTEMNQTLQLRLEAPKAEDEELLRKLNEPPRAIAVWKPEPVNNDPLEGLGPIKRAWVKLVHPEMMRRKAA